MAKAIETTIILNNQWGHVYAPETFPSKRQALEHARFMIDNGYAWAYRIIKPKQVKNQQK
jgi:hypothetical protein